MPTAPYPAHPPPLLRFARGAWSTNNSLTLANNNKLPAPIPPRSCWHPFHSFARFGYGPGVAFMKYIPELNQVYYADKGSNVLKVSKAVGYPFLYFAPTPNGP